MKGLTLNCLARKEEAYELVQKGLRNDLHSHVCWHVYGLLYRSDRNYAQAIKCYLNALKKDPGNLQILRDLALLQIQMRDLPGFLKTRNELLVAKPGNGDNWTAYAVSHHLMGDHRDREDHRKAALIVLESYQKSKVADGSKNQGYRDSELELYTVRILEEDGRHAEALKHLGEADENIVDRVVFLETKARLHLALDHRGDAKAAYLLLIKMQPENSRYFEGFVKACGLGLQGQTAEQIAELDALFAKLGRAFPRATPARRLPLDYRQGDGFLAAADAYVRRPIRKGVPSLFADLKPLYADAAKAGLLEQLMTGYLEALAAGGKFPAAVGTGEDEGPEPPSSEVWVRLYLAQHFRWRGLLDEALGMVDAAIAHTPTVIELYNEKANIMLGYGDYEGAAFLADYARKLDLADRYLNCEAVKFMLRAGQVEEAERTAALFTKDGDQLNNLFDMQAMWYEIASGDVFLRKREYGRALKQYSSVFKHFEDIHEDQFDFHTYCVRTKMTLSTYLDMLKLEDNLYEHEFYRLACLGACQCYLALADDPPKTDAQIAQEEEAMLAQMTSAERKKYKAKKRKEAARREKEEEEKRKAATSGKNKGKKEVVVDEDPLGEKLMRTPEPLQEASRLLARLLGNRKQFLETHLMAFELALRKGKLLQALLALQKARGLDAAEPRVHLALVRLAARAEAEAAGTHAAVGAVLGGRLAALLGAGGAAACNAAFLEAHGGSLPHRLAGAEAMAVLDPAARADAVLRVTGPGPAGASQAECEEAHRRLQGPPFAAGAEAEAWYAACQAAFPRSQYFRGALWGDHKGLLVIQEAIEKLEIA